MIMQDIGNIRIENYDYPLPDDRIAKFPLDERDQSKLLCLKNGTLSEKKFRDIPGLLPKRSLLVFNETKVIRARMLFRKETGALIEIFCLEPVSPSNDFQLAFQEKSPVVWKCLIGNAKRWKSGSLEALLEKEGNEVRLKVRKLKQLADAYLIGFSWDQRNYSFGEIIEMNGLVPLPPYLHREAVESDKKRYQTVYAKNDGSVAAPTAGLHFTDPLLDKIREQGTELENITLHVGAGTFKPVISSTIADHDMHTEKAIVSEKTLVHLQKKLNDGIIPVGTTSMRTLESLYWLAAKIDSGQTDLFVDQWDPYALTMKNGFTSGKALDVLIGYLEEKEVEYLKFETRLMIVPGYKFRFASGLITNFHQPKSTLLLLVSALIGEQWKEAYDFALQNNFRFLSYGDSCLFLPEK